MRHYNVTASALVCTAALTLLSVAPAAAVTDHPTVPETSTSPSTSAASSSDGDSTSLADAAAAHQQGLADNLVDKAEREVEKARKALTAAERVAARLRKQADEAHGKATQARRDLGNIARAAYAGSQSEMVGLASLVDSPNPEDAMRRAAVAQLVAEHQDDQFQDATVLAGRVDELRAQADSMVEQAEQRLTAAERLLKGIRGQRGMLAELSEGSSGGNGSTALARKCLSVDVLVPICAKPRWTEAHLTFDTVVIGRTVNVMWPQVKQVGGWRPSDPYPDHPSGRAADIMMPTAGHSKESVKLGNEIAAYFQKHAAEYGIYYMIWRQRIWMASNPVGQWSTVSNRGDWTANHMDHVHISVTNGTSGTAWEALVLQARTAQSKLG